MARSMATMAPDEAAVSAAAYSAIDTMMYAATLPWPASSFQPVVPPNAKNRPAGNTRVKKSVRRLRSIRLISIPRIVRVEPAERRDLAGGGIDAGGARHGAHHFSSWVRLRKASSRPLEVISRSRASVSVSR